MGSLSSRNTVFLGWALGFGFAWALGPRLLALTAALKLVRLATVSYPWATVGGLKVENWPFVSDKHTRHRGPSDGCLHLLQLFPG